MYGVRHQYGIRATGTTATIPDNPMARLMYYLKSVDILVDFGIPDDLCDYRNYYNLSFDEENQVLMLATILTPDLFVKKGVMINEPRLCPDANNEFYEISDVQHAIAVTEEFTIAGKQVHTLRIMAFKMAWIENNYINPIKFYLPRIKALANGTADSYRPRAITYNPNTSYDESSVSEAEHSKKHSKCCLLL